MERDEALELVKRILWQEADIERSEVQEDRVLLGVNGIGGGSLGLDSLDVLEMVMAVEEETGLDISDEEVEEWVKVGDVLDYLEGR